MEKHSTVVGGSSCARVITCPGSIKLVRRAPEKEVGKAAKIGSACHWVMETCLESETSTPQDFIGRRVLGVTITDDIYSVKLSRAWNWFHDWLRPDEFFVERRVSWSSAIPGGFGTADIIYRRGSRTGLVDWKFGERPVEAVNSPQLKFYLGAAVLHTMPSFFKRRRSFDAHIYQPFSDLSQIPHKLTSFNRSELIEFGKQLSDAVKEGQKRDPLFVISDHCDWCPASGFCGKLKKQRETQIDVADPAAAMVEASLMLKAVNFGR